MTVTTPLELIAAFNPGQMRGACGDVDKAQLKTALSDLFTDNPPDAYSFLDNLEVLGVMHQGMPGWDCYRIGDLLVECLQCPGTDKAVPAVLKFLVLTAEFFRPLGKVNAPAMLAKLEPKLINIDPDLDHWRHPDEEQRDRLFDMMEFDEARDLLVEAQTLYALPRWMRAASRYVKDPDRYVRRLAKQIVRAGSL